MIDIRKELPKPGVVGENGIITFWENFPIKFAVRPDYTRFKSNDYNSESDCVDVLIGMDSNTLHRVVEEKKKEASLKKCLYSMDNKARTLRDTGSFLHDIKEKIEIGKLVPDGIGGFVDSKFDKPSILEKDFFKTYTIFKTLPFLLWMQKNGYPIPDELSFQEKNGKLSWEKDSSTLKRTPIPIDIQSGVGHKKTKSQLDAITIQMFNDGVHRKDIAKTLYGSELDAGEISMDGALKRVDRSRGKK